MMALKKKLKKINTRYFAEMKYPKYLDNLPIDEKAVFLESQQGLGIDGNIWYIARELMINPDYADYKMYISAKNQAVADKVRSLIARYHGEARTKVVRTSSSEYYMHLASAKYLYNDNTFNSAFVKKEGQIYTNTWHGTPLKTLGRTDRTNMHLLGNVQKNFFFTDYIMCPNKFTYDCLANDYMLENLCHATVIMNGYPRNTAFMDNDKAEELRNKYNLVGKRVYAYMPTWRYFKLVTKQNEKDLITKDFKDFVSVEKQAVQEHETFSELTHQWLKQLDIMMADDEIMYVKAHLREEKDFVHNVYQHIREWPADEETYEFLNACDCLVTDYSSVMFDYALTRRKCVLFAYDEDDYMKNWGLHMGLDRLPFPVVKSLDCLLDELRSDKNYDDELFLYNYCRYDNEQVTRKLLARTICGKSCGTEFEVPNNKKKNILMFVGNLAPNGVTASLKGLLTNIDTNKYNYYINFQGPSVSPYRSFLHTLPAGVKYISRIGKMPITFRQNIVMRLYNNKLISLDKFWKVMKPAYERDVRRQFGDNKFDIVIQFTGYEYKKSLTYSLMGDKRYMMIHSNMIAEKKTRDNQRLDVLRYAYNNYDKMIAVSEAMVEPTQKIAGKPVDVDVIYNLIDIKRVEYGSKKSIAFTKFTETNIELDALNAILDSPAKVYVSVGRFSPEKGHDRLVRAFDRYWKTHQDDYLIIQGGSQTDDYYERLIKQVDTLESREHILLIKRLDNPFALVKRCDGSILSSYYEGFGLVLIEGDILGIPVVTVDIDGPRKFMQDNGGTIVENSEDGLYEAFNLLSDGRVPVMNVDYDKMNEANANKFEKLLG